jgi:predicted phosphodiesterase
MKFAILSDIHSNLEALKAVMDDINQFNIDEIYNLGDIVGYGEQPNEVIQMLIENNIKSVMGNHDFAMLNPQVHSNFNDEAKDKLALNRDVLDDASLKYLMELPYSISTNNMRMVHGMPPDNFWDYLYLCTAAKIRYSFQHFKEKIAFVGHSHRFNIYQFSKNEVQQIPFIDEVYKLHRKRTIVNVGSVGPALRFGSTSWICYL